MIIGYLAIFRLEEIGITSFAALVAALDPTSMHVFLSYLFDKSNLFGPIKVEWIRMLDEAFVENEIIAKMLSFEAEITLLLQQLHAKAFGQAASKETPKITQPRPRQAVEPIWIPQEVKANPVPPNLNQLTLADLKKQQLDWKQKIADQVAKKYEAAAKTMFHFESMAKSNLESIRQEVEATRNAQSQFDFKAKPAPDFASMGASGGVHEVKLNTAAILREDAQLIRAYETELRDPIDFYCW